MRWKVVCIVGQSGRTIGYDMLSEGGEKRTVTIQQLVNAIASGVVANARINEGKLEFSEQLPKRVIEQVINIQLTESEFNTLYPYLCDMYQKLAEKHPEKNEKVLVILNKFVGYKNRLSEIEH